VAEVPQAGWEQIFPSLFANRTVTVDPGQRRIRDRLWESGAAGTIRGQKWNDVNANGIKDAGEPGLAGWTIFSIKTGTACLIRFTVGVGRNSFSIGTVLEQFDSGVSHPFRGFLGGALQRRML